MGKDCLGKRRQSRVYDAEIIVVELLQLPPRFADTDTFSSRFCSESQSSPMVVIVLVPASRGGICSVWNTVSCLQVMVSGWC